MSTLAIILGALTLGSLLLGAAAVLRPPDPAPGRTGPWRWLRDHAAQILRRKAVPPPPLPRRNGVPPGHPEHSCDDVDEALQVLQQRLWPYAEYQQIIIAVRAEKHREQS